MSLIIGIGGGSKGSAGNNQIYGVVHNYENASPILTRCGNLDLHRTLPI